MNIYRPRGRLTALQSGSRHIRAGAQGTDGSVGLYVERISVSWLEAGEGLGKAGCDGISGIRL